jgi:hypothetical protein
MLLVFHNVQQRGHEYVEGYVSAVRDRGRVRRGQRRAAPSRSGPDHHRDAIGRSAVSGVWGVHVAGEGPAGASGQGSARIGAADQAVVAEASIAVR